MCGLSCHWCLPSVGRKEIPQLQYFDTFPFPSFLFVLLRFRIDPFVALFHLKIRSVVPWKVREAPSLSPLDGNVFREPFRFAFLS